MYDRASRTVADPFVNSTIIRGTAVLRSRKVTLLTGAVYAIGSVLGVASLGTATSAAKAGGNTGGGTLTVDASTPVLTGAKAGVYTVRCIALASNGGTFEVKDPDGFVLGEYAIGGSAFANDIKFAMADVGTDFAVGDGFDITVAAGTGKAKLSLAAAVDGSQAPSLILPYEVDATGGDVEAIVYESGDFIEEQLVFGTGHTANSTREGLRIRNITFG